MIIKERRNQEVPELRLEAASLRLTDNNIAVQQYLSYLVPGPNITRAEDKLERHMAKLEEAGVPGCR
jgi:hypothetical protein